MPVTLPPGRDKLCTYPCKIGSKLAARSTIGTSGRAAAAACSPDWLKLKNAAAPAVKREADEDWGRPVFCQQSGGRLPATGGADAAEASARPGRRDRGEPAGVCGVVLRRAARPQGNELMIRDLYLGK